MRLLVFSSLLACVGATTLIATFNNDDPSLVDTTLRLTDGSNVMTNYPSLNLAPGSTITIDQSDSTNAGLAFIISDPAFSVTYNCPGLSSCSAADYVGLNAFRYKTDGSLISLPGLTQTIRAPLVAAQSSYHIAGYPTLGNTISVSVDKSKTAELYALTTVFPILFFIANEVALRLLVVRKGAPQEAVSRR